MEDKTKIITYIVEQISLKNPLHGKKLIKNLKNFDEVYYIKVNRFLKKYIKLLNGKNKTIDYSIDCYLQMIADVNFETVQFIRTGNYTSKTFEEVNKKVYNNPIVMEYYMHGLLLSQFLWLHHYYILLFFNEIINKNLNKINYYLEIGGGHGLYISEAIDLVGDKAHYDLVDISKSSIEMSKKMTENNNINYIHSDIYDYSPKYKYNFITMGEVLEHVEDPISLLKKLNSFLNEDGKIFITTPTNAPAIDHIYLFKNAEDIRKIIEQAGFNIEEEKCFYSEDVPIEKAEKYKISMMYAVLINNKTKNGKI